MEGPTLHRGPAALGDSEVRAALEVREALEGQEGLEGNRETTSPLKPLSSKAEVMAFSLILQKVCILNRNKHTDRTGGASSYIIQFKVNKTAFV